MDDTVTFRTYDTLAKANRPVGLKECPLNNVDVSYEQLIAPVEDRMIRSIWRIVRDADDAQDTLQEALTIIWRRLDRIRNHPNPRALILKICTDAAYDQLRKHRRHRSHEDPDILEDLQDQSGSVGSAELVKKETEAEILDAISRLPKKQAVAILMRIVQEEPYEVIAQALGCSEGTVRINVSRGRNRLSQWLAHLKPFSLQTTAEVSV